MKTLQALTAGVSIAFLAGCKPPEKIELVKADWECVQTHIKSSSSILIVGKVFIPQTTNEVVCDMYRRVKSNENE